MLRFSNAQPAEFRVSDLPFPRPFSDSDRIANALWLLENNPTGRALLPAEYRDEDGPRFTATMPAANDPAVAEGIAARLAGENAAGAGQQSGDMPPQNGQLLLAQNTGGGSAQQDPKFYDFFDQHYAPITKLANQYGVDPTLILGLSAHESTWGTSPMATQLNNPFGGTPDAQHGLSYPSTDAAWEAWGKMFGPRVANLGNDAEAFVDRLLLDNRNVYGPTIGGDRRGVYNTQKAPKGDPYWKDRILDAIESVQGRIPAWLQLKSMQPSK